MGDLAGRTVVITGASRGIGRAIALRAARDGARVAVLAKTDRPHPKLEGTIHETAAAIVAAGGEALPIATDVRDELAVERAVAMTAERFGGIDAVVNNASAIDLSGTEALAPRRFDLLHEVNVRGTWLVSRACLPHLRRAPNPHILTLSPPIELDPRWLDGHSAYTVSKYGMSMLMLGMAAEYRAVGVACNALWPRTTIATAAVEHALGGAAMLRRSRVPEIVADAAHAILTTPARTLTGQLLLDEDILSARGVTDFDRYAVSPGEPLQPDLFVDADRWEAMADTG